MTRYDFLLYHRDVPAFLENLRELGLVDVTLRDFEPTEEQRTKAESVKNYTTIFNAMKSISGEGEKFSNIDEAIECYTRAVSRVDELGDEIRSLKAERKRVEPWGSFDACGLQELKEQGVILRFFEISTKHYKKEWEHIYPIEVIARENSKTYFVVAATKENADELLDISAVEVAAPVASFDNLELQIEECEGKIAEQQKVIARAALSAEDIKARTEELAEDLEYIKVLNSADDEVDGTVKVLEGWSEKTREAEIVDFVKTQDVYYTVGDAKVEQKPPIKLKNSFFARLFEPIGSIYLYPLYNELDLTLFFAPFFMIFFGMCFGDAGYGLLLITVTLLFWKKIPAGFKDFGWLIIFLNLAAVVFGIFSGNIFGIALAEVDALKEFKEFFLSPDDIFYLSVIIGAVQLIFGLVLRTFNRIRRGGSFIYGVSNIGWLILLISSGVAYSGICPEIYGSDSIAYDVTLYLALAMILFFSVPYKPFASIGKGLYSFYEMSTGLIGDLISYVRLFAIGLAGTVIAQVFNELAVGLSGNIPVVSFIVMALILLIGHGLNIFISILGAIVHPIRLTFVEFYKNAEFEGGGRKFSPFKRKNK